MQKYVNETNTMKRGVEEHANAPDKQYQTSKLAKVCFSSGTQLE